MRYFIIASVLASAVALGLIVPRGSSAPALADKAARFEYGELRFSDIVVFPPGQPGGPKPQPVRQVTARWTTTDDEVEGGGWAELGDKLKAPAVKKDASGVVLKLRVFNRLGADGWEAYDRTNGPEGRTEIWSLKRRLP